MKAFSKVAWAALALLGAFCLGTVALRRGDGSKQNHGVQIDVGIEPGQCQGSEGSGPACSGPGRRGGFQPGGPEGTFGGKERIDEQESRSTYAGDGDEPRGRSQQGTESRDPSEDQDRVGQQANRDSCPDMFPADSLAQQEGVLGADGNYEGQAGGHAGYEGKECH